jgi:hypothetical protein
VPVPLLLLIAGSLLRDLAVLTFDLVVTFDCYP